MWIDFKPIYNTLETQTVFVRELHPKTPPTWAAYSNPQTSQLNLAHFTWVGFARLASTDSQIFFLYYPLTMVDFFRKKGKFLFSLKTLNGHL